MGEWLIVARSRKIPGGYRICRSRLSEADAKALAPTYKQRREAMSAAELIDLRMAAIARGERMPT